MNIFPVKLNGKKYSGETIYVVSNAYLAASWWFEFHLTSWTHGDLKSENLETNSVYSHL